MKKAEFIEKLREKLNGLPQEDIEKSLDYYSEMIDDRVEDGMSEDDAVSDLGSIDEIASQIIGDTSLPKIIIEKLKSKTKPDRLKIVLYICAIPIILAVLSCIFAMIAAFAGIIISVYIGTVTFGLCGIGGLALGGISIAAGAAIKGIFLIGDGISCIGVCVIGFAFSKAITKLLFKYGRKFIRFIKRSIFRKGEV